MSAKMYKYEGQEFEVTEKGCSLEARPIGWEEPDAYGSVVPSNNYQFPFIGQLLSADGQHINSGLAASVEQALTVACGYVLAYRTPDQERACKDIGDFYSTLGSEG